MDMVEKLLYIISKEYDAAIKMIIIKTMLQHGKCLKFDSKWKELNIKL